MKNIKIINSKIYFNNHRIIISIIKESKYRKTLINTPSIKSPQKN